MGVEGGTKIIKYLMIIFNFIFFVLGVGVLAMGIYAREKKGEWDSYTIVMNDASTSSWNSFSSLCIAVGVLVIVLGSSGCVGAWRENRCLLGVFASLVALIVLLEFIAAGVGYHYRGKLEDDLREKLNTTLRKANTTADPGNKYFNAWNDVQKEQGCCGVDHPSDWNSKPGGIPSSCGVNPQNKPGCYNKIKDKLGKWTVWAGAALGIAFVQILAIIFAVKMMYDIGRQDTYSVV